MTPSEPRPPVPPPAKPPTGGRRIAGVFVGIAVVAGTYVGLVFLIAWLMQEFFGARGYDGLLAIPYAAWAQILVTVPLAVWAWRRDWKGLGLSLAIGGGIVFLGVSACMGVAFLS